VIPWTVNSTLYSLYVWRKQSVFCVFCIPQTLQDFSSTHTIHHLLSCAWIMVVLSSVGNRLEKTLGNFTKWSKRYLEAWAKGSFCENLPGTNLLANFTLYIQKLITNLLLFVSCMGEYACKGETTEWCSFHLVPRFEECSPGVVGNLIILGGNIISNFSSVPGLNFS